MMALRADGKSYAFAAHNYNCTASQLAAVGKPNAATGNQRNSEWAGSCFSPDGRVLFVNLYTGVTLAFVTFRDEELPSMSFSAIINNFSGYNFDGLTVRLTGTVVMPTQVAMSLSSDEPFGLTFGNPLSEVGASDWMIDFSAVESGATFGLSVPLRGGSGAGHDPAMSRLAVSLLGPDGPLVTAATA